MVRKYKTMYDRDLELEMGYDSSAPVEEKEKKTTKTNSFLDMIRGKRKSKKEDKENVSKAVTVTTEGAIVTKTELAGIIGDTAFIALCVGSGTYIVLSSLLSYIGRS